MGLDDVRVLLAVEEYAQAAELGACIFPLLIALERDDDDGVKYGTCCVFELHGDTGVDYLLEQLASGSRAAAWILVELRTASQYPRIATALLGRLDSDVLELRREVAWALGHIGRRAPLTVAVEPLLARTTLVLSAEDLRSLLYALDLVAKHADLPGALGHITSIMRNTTDPLVRRAALGCIGKMSRSSRIPDPLVDQIASMLDSSATMLRYRAAYTLGRIGRSQDLPQVVAALIRSCEDVKPRVRSMAAQSLGDIGARSGAAQAVPVLERLSGDADYGVAWNGQQALERLRGADVWQGAFSGRRGHPLEAGAVHAWRMRLVLWTEAARRASAPAKGPMRRALSALAARPSRLPARRVRQAPAHLGANTLRTQGLTRARHPSGCLLHPFGDPTPPQRSHGRPRPGADHEARRRAS